MQPNGLPWQFDVQSWMPDHVRAEHRDRLERGVVVLRTVQTA